MAENADLLVLYTFVNALCSAGVADVCISPGSRSTPLTLAFVRSGAFRVWTLLDERSAGFFAVGLARAGRPAALVCTSGSATANYHPAVMEASAARLPLIVLTADRPPELHDVGANQTTSQRSLYEPLVKWTVNMPVPQHTPALHRHAEATAWRLAHLACAQPQGPVHLNWPLREPLIPPAPPMEPTRTRIRSAYLPVATPDAHAVDMLVAQATLSPRGLFVCGPQTDPALADAVLHLAEQLKVPVIADVLSQMRRQQTDGRTPSCLADLYDIWLRDQTIRERLAPDWIIRFGAAPTSKAVSQYLADFDHIPQIVIDAHPNWRDATGSTSDVVTADATQVCRLLNDRLTEAPACTTTDEGGWLRLWQAVSERARSALQAALGEPETTEPASVPAEVAQALAFEGRLFVELADLLPDDVALFLGNSMPVRDAESFLPALPPSVRILANRGVSGIDGVVSSAVGSAAGLNRRVVLVIGDVSFYHDQNGLLAAAQNQLDLVVLLVNNDGGGIFSFLPQAAYQETFAHFRTAHGLDFAGTVAMYSGTLRRPRNWPEVRRDLAEALNAPGLQVVEVRTDMEQNVAYNRHIVRAVQTAVLETFR